MLEYKLNCDKNLTRASRSNTGTLGSGTASERKDVEKKHDEVRYLCQHEDDDDDTDTTTDVLIHLSPIVNILSVLQEEYMNRKEESKEDEETRLKHLETCLRATYRKCLRT